MEERFRRKRKECKKDLGEKEIECVLTTTTDQTTTCSKQNAYNENQTFTLALVKQLAVEN